MNIRDVLQAQKIDALDARLLLQHVLQCTHAEIIANPERELSDKQAEMFEAFVARRAQHEPVAYLTGSKEFWGLEFEVTPATLIPRPDSETLVEAVLRTMPSRAKPLKILDFGTGSGCLLLAILSEFPSATGLGIDRSQAALAVAQRNAEKLGLAKRAHFMLGDWSEAVTGGFDVIVSNPPYIAESEWNSLPADVAKFEPGSALTAGLDGLDDYRRLLPGIPALLREGGMAAFEIGHTQARSVQALAAMAGMRNTSVAKDLAGLDRAIIYQR